MLNMNRNEVIQTTDSILFKFISLTNDAKSKYFTIFSSSKRGR